MNEDKEADYASKRHEAAAQRIHHSMMRKLGREVPRDEQVLGPDLPVVYRTYDPHRW